MKIAEVDWPLFWHALNQQDSASRNRWLGRWVFADEGVEAVSAAGASRDDKLQSRRRLQRCGKDALDRTGSRGRR
jgi:hypothetical protein